MLCVAFFSGAMLLAGPSGTAAAAPKPESPWVAMTKTDLQAMRDLIKANHPGMVDP